MPEAVKILDTSTLSEIMKRHDRRVLRHARRYLKKHGRFTFSLLTRYEVLRGLYAKGASRQIEEFELRCAASDILALTDPIVVRAARIYAQLRSEGRVIEDADILIAATALAHGLALVTENVRHFERIQGLEIESWRSKLAAGG